MTSTRILWLVEDDDLKGRTIMRIVQKLRPDLEVVRLHSLQEWLDVIASLYCGKPPSPRVWPGRPRPWATVPEHWIGVITDWRFPRRYGESAQPIGDRVLESLDGTGIPRVVVSSADRPADFQANWGTIDWLTWGDSDALRKWLADL